ncbi:MAG: hypothetical protein QM820_14785 [Minicystis sp.]
MKQAGSTKAGSVSDADLRLALREAVTRIGRPTSPPELRKALPKPYQRPAPELARLLAELAREGSLFAVKEGRAVKYADRDPAAVLGPAIAAALRDGPLAKKELADRVKRAAAGFDKLFPVVLAAEVARGAVREHPKAGKAPLRYGLEAPDPTPYLAKVMKDLAALQKKLAVNGVTPAAIHAALGRALGVAPERRATASGERPPSNGDAAADDALVRAALRDLAAREPPGALLAVRVLRGMVPLDKDRFDRAALRLAQAGELVLHHHDFPESLPEAARAELVRDERGLHYGGVAPRDGGRS